MYGACLVSYKGNYLPHVYENFFLEELHNELFVYYCQHTTAFLHYHLQ
jgi:hypothetical protein